MKLYIIIIAAANVIIAGINAAIGNDFFVSFSFTLMSTVAVIAVDGATAYLVRRLPERWFSADNTLFNVGMNERKFYKKVKIKKWKDKIPELGGFTGLHKSRVDSKTDAEYLSRFLLESNYGVVIHIANAVFGFTIVLIPFGANITVPVAIVNAVLTFLPVLVLRYNTPILKTLYLKSQKKKAV